jgi:hypothetical protein
MKVVLDGMEIKMPLLPIEMAASALEMERISKLVLVFINILLP